MKHLILPLLLLCWLAPRAMAEPGRYSLSEEWLEQPVDHGAPEGGHFKQQILLLRPDTAGPDARVFFVLGNESDATAEELVALYTNYGSPGNMVFVTAEHRGYGQSITRAEQTRPEYVRVDQALHDYHRVVTHLKARYHGQWVAAGYSYGGALVINFAHDFPDDVDVILSSSAPIRWPFLIPQYSQQVNENLGEGLTGRLAQHINNLQPRVPYDKTWQQREALTGFIVGLSQIGEIHRLKPFVNALSFLPTWLFVRALAALDTKGATQEWVLGRLPGPMSHERASTGRWNWYTWKYQQCSEVGTFFSGAPFGYTEEEHVEDCRATFGGRLQLGPRPWNVSGMIAEVEVPQVFVVGGKDPWSRLGAEPDQFSNVEVVYEAEGFHCPDRSDPVLAGRVMALLVMKLGG